MGRRRIRSFVRRWINEWDLRRLYPESEPDIEVTELQLRYGEDRALEQPASDDLDLPIIGEAGTPPYELNPPAAVEDEPPPARG